MKRVMWMLSIVALVLMVCVCNSFAESYRHPPTGLVFPDQFAGMSKGEVTEFDKDNPGSDVGIGYNLPNITLTIYLYNPSAPDFESPAFKKHFDECVDEIMKVRPNGKKTSEGVVSFRLAPTPLRAQFASFNGVSNRGEYVSIIYLMVYKDRYLKIRYTYSKDSDTMGEATFKRVIETLAAMLN